MLPQVQEARSSYRMVQEFTTLKTLGDVEHWQNYKDDMFTLDIEKEKWGLKPVTASSSTPGLQGAFYPDGGISHRAPE